jgi:predicted dehydrogenase
VIRWGVAGPGSIATGFAEAMELVAGGSIVAVGSRSQERADAFGNRFDIARRHGNYEALAADPEVDVVYVATPQSRHAEDTTMFLQAGKHVLCEKPFALNSTQAQAMIDEARRQNLFLMDAVWSRFLPAYQVLGDLLREERIGDPLMVEADFGFRSPPSLENRLFRPELGGGGLLDLGIYPLQLCSLVLGNPVGVVADGVIGETDVDEQVAAIVRHPEGRLGVIKAALRVNMTCRARITGTDGVIELPAMMHCPDSVNVASSAGIEEIDCTYEGNGLRFEIEAVGACIDAGKSESQLMPLDETLVLISTLDSIRQQIGFRFPTE